MVMVTIVVLSHLRHTSLRGPSEKVLIQGCHVGPLGAKFLKLGPKIFVWPFGSFWPFSRIDWPLSRIRSDHPWTCLRSHIFSLF